MTAIVVTPEDVSNVTGATVTAEDIAKAVGFIEAMTGLDLSALPERATARDAHNLTRAVIWQAAHTAAGGDTPRDPTVAAASANGASVSYAAPTGEDTELGLSQLAARYLARLSWRRRTGGIRTVHVTPEALAQAGVQTLVEDEGVPPWVPLGGVA